MEAIAPPEVAVDDASVVSPSTHSGSSPAPARRDPLDWVYTFGFALAGWYVGLRPLSDNSFFWHLRTGRMILADGIPSSDPFSFSAPGIAWVAQSWLAEAAYALTERAAGAFGIRLLVAATSAAIAVVLFRTALLLVGDRRRATLLALGAWLVTLAVLSERPLIFGLLAMAVLVRLVEDPQRALAGRAAARLRWQVPLLLWLWANTHGSFSLGLVYIGATVVGDWLDGRSPWSANRDLVIGTAIGLAVIVLNPYGLALLAFPVQLVSRGDVLSQVIEWTSPSFREPNGMLLGAWIVALVVALARGGRLASRRDVLVSVTFVVLALWAQRNIGLAVVATMPVLARQIARPRRVRSTDRGFVVIATSAFGVLLVMATIAAAGQPDFDRSAYPVKAMRYLERNDGLGTRLLTTDAWAGFVIERFGPDRQKVFLDDRFDMYPPALVDDYDEIADGRPGWRRELDAHRIETVVWPHARNLAQLLALDDGWTEVYRDDQAVVFTRR